VKFEKEDVRAHKAALIFAIVGPMINYFLKQYYMHLIPSVFVYWFIVLGVYIVVLFKFFTDNPTTLLRLVILGIALEDFASGFWNAFFSGVAFLPMTNWYLDYFPFFDVLGEPVPMIGIPIWHVIFYLAYMALTYIQYDSLKKKNK
jgi:hypothetical protein